MVAKVALSLASIAAVTTVVANAAGNINPPPDRDFSTMYLRITRSIPGAKPTAVFNSTEGNSTLASTSHGSVLTTSPYSEVFSSSTSTKKVATSASSSTASGLKESQNSSKSVENAGANHGVDFFSVGAAVAAYFLI